MRILFVLLLFVGSATPNSRVIKFRQLGWSLEIPSDINFKDSAFDNLGHINVASWDVPVFSKNPRAELFWIQNDHNNYFNTIVSIDSSNHVKWEEDIIQDSRYYIGLIAETRNYAILDSSISVEKIDGVNLQKEYIKFCNKTKQDTIYSYKFSRRYKNYSINMNIRYKDKLLGDKYIGIFSTSKFDK